MNTKRHIAIVACSVILTGSIILPTSAQELSREERIKIIETLRTQDAQWEKNASFEAITLSSKAATELDKLELPPLSVFLDAVSENATVKRAQSAVEESKNEYSLEKRNWWDWFHLNGSYSYGRYNVLSNASDEFTPMYQTTMSSAQHSYNVGASVGISFGDIFNRKKKLKKYKYQIEQLKYSQEEVMEERRLRVVQAYNEVTVQLATIRARAETAALYNAEMRISENDFIQGKIDITGLAIERARRSGAVVAYEEARISLHNAIILLEMLTNVKIIKE